MLSESDKKELRDYLRDTSPLGPRDAHKIESEVVAKILFENDNQIYKNIIKKPSIVVGRRGSGKTSFLKHLQNYEFFGHLVINIELNNAIENLETFILSRPNGRLPKVESVSTIWDWLFWIALLSHVRSKYPNSYAIQEQKYPLGEKFKSWFARFQFTTLAGLANVLSDPNQLPPGVGSIAGAILSSTPGFTSERLRTVKKVVKQTLKRSAIRAVILIDTLEEYGKPDEITDLVLSGLLKSAGQFNAVSGRPELRLCIPSERYFYFYGISSNTTKDFEYDIKLHWHPRELLNLTANRYLTFLLCNEDRVDSLKLKSLSEIRNSAPRRSWGVEFWKEIFPKNVKNRYGSEEPSIPYIIRHTHLLPRQLIMYLNKITSLNIKRNQPLTEISSEVIVSALTSIESDVWEEVCNAYKASYPDAIDICNYAIPHLPLVFERGKLEVVFRENVKSHIPQFKDVNMDYTKFERMMIEMGCVGIVRSNHLGGVYVRADFEYNNTSRLPIHTNSVCCLHPMFCSLRPAPANGEKTKTVMPFGNEPDAEDNRDW